METISKEILKALGNEKNISSIAHCATRLRIAVKNESKVDEEKIKSISGVLGLVKNLKEYQIIIGPGVESVYLEFLSLGDFSLKNQKEEDSNKEEIIGKPDSKKNYFLSITDFIAGAVLPTLPVIVAGGMISALLVTLSTFFGFSEEAGAYTILQSVYTAAFQFLPIFIGYNAAKKLSISPMLGALLGGVLVAPEINGVAGLDFFGIPVTEASYGSSVLPVIFGVAAMSVIYKPLDKKIPKEIKFFAVPLITMLISVPVTVIAIGPMATWLGQIIGQGLLWMNVNLGWLSVGVMGGITAVLIFSGTGSGLYAAIFLAFAENKAETFVMPGMLAGNLAIGGAAMAVVLMTKNKENKALALSSGLTAVFGITEPAVFGVLARFRTPFIGATIGGAIGGLFAGFMNLAEYAFVSPGVASIIAFINPDGTHKNFIVAIITMILSFISGFLATLLIGLKEKEEESKKYE